MKTKLIMTGMMMSLFVVPGLLSAVVRTDRAEQEFAGDRDASGTHRALLVGINEYDPHYGPTPLDCCVNDATGVRSTILLADPGRRWSASLIQVLTNNFATAGAIRTALQSLAAASQSGDLILYYHSSHGGQYSGTSVYLCAYDQDYSAVNLGQDLTLFNSGVTVIVVVDACHSGGLFKQKDGWPFAEMTMQAYTEAKTKQYLSKGLAVPKDLGNNIAFMTACDYNQLSQEKYPNGLYTGGLLAGCRDSAVDLNQDGFYQFSELYIYAARVASAENPNQTAQQFHEAVLTSMVARTVGGIISTNKIEGDFDGDGYADPYWSSKSSVSGVWTIWMSSGSYAPQGPFEFSASGGVPARVADFDGDGKADPVMVSASGGWYIWMSSSSYARQGPFTFSASGVGEPAAADFDGDRYADPAMVSGGNWYVWFTSLGYQMGGPYSLGGSGTPLAADFDGDRYADPAMVDTTSGSWTIWMTSGGYAPQGPFTFSAAGANPTPLAGDFDGDRRADPVMVVNYYWTVWMSSGQYAPQGPFPFNP